MTELLIRALTPCPEHEQALVELEDADRRLQLALLIPMNEANRLARSLGLVPCPCVPVFELIESLLARFEGRVRRAVLDGSDAGVFATLYVDQGDVETSFVCHPADALALARRAGVRIYAMDGALQHAFPMPECIGDETGPSGLRQWLDQVSPGDFEEPRGR